ncbi:MAG: hypothetical protein ACK5MZ_05260 [Aestuariibaculum sp.]
MIIFGWRETKINIQPVNNHRCNYCNSPEQLFMQVNRVYAHVFWIPVIPLLKKAYSICGHCKQVLEKRQMPPDLQTKSNTYKQTSRTPWWMFSGLFIVVFLFLFVIIKSI